VGGKQFGGGSTEPRAAAGDEKGLIFELHVAPSTIEEERAKL
jgi:hypothetical protein